MVIRVEVRGLAQAVATVQAVPGASKAAAGRFVGRAGVAVLRYWKVALSGPGGPSRLGVRSGRLRSSVRLERRGPLTAAVGTDAPYAAIHEFGGTTKPHIIRPRVGKVLMFKGNFRTSIKTRRVSSSKIFAKFVNHPGSKIPARPHRRVAMEAARPVIDRFAEDASKEIIKAADAKARVFAGGGVA